MSVVYLLIDTSCMRHLFMTLFSLSSHDIGCVVVNISKFYILLKQAHNPCYMQRPRSADPQLR